MVSRWGPKILAEYFKTILCMDDDRRAVMCDQKSLYVLGKEKYYKYGLFSFKCYGGIISCYVCQMSDIDSMDHEFNVVVCGSYVHIK